MFITPGIFRKKNNGQKWIWGCNGFTRRQVLAAVTSRDIGHGGGSVARDRWYLRASPRTAEHQSKVPSGAAGTLEKVEESVCSGSLLISSVTLGAVESVCV